MSRKGFIGLGVMGSAMAGHIANKFSNVVVYNRTSDKANSWVKAVSYTHLTLPTKRIV